MDFMMDRLVTVFVIAEGLPASSSSSQCTNQVLNLVADVPGSPEVADELDDAGAPSVHTDTESSSSS